MIYATIGCAASGKSTWAKKFAQENGFNYVSSDEIRNELYGNPEIQGNGADVFRVFHDRIRSSCLVGKPVICDATHYNQMSRSAIFNISQELSVPLEWHYFPVSLEEALYRNKNRERVVPEEVVKRQWKDLRLPAEGLYVVHSEFNVSDYPIQNRKHIFFDLDGTLALMCDRSPFDASKADGDYPNYPVVKTLEIFASSGFIPVFVSARECVYVEPTIRFLKNHTGIDVGLNENLFMRNMGDNRQDAVVKIEIFLKRLLPKNIVPKIVFDDRNGVVAAWRSLNLTCFQVAEGNF